MYTVNKGPSRFVTKTRPGLIASTHLDGALTIRPIVRRANSQDSSSSTANGTVQTAMPSSSDATSILFNDRLTAAPRPVFHQTTAQHRKGGNSNSHNYNNHQQHQHNGQQQISATNGNGSANNPQQQHHQNQPYSKTSSHWQQQQHHNHNGNNNNDGTIHHYQYQYQNHRSFFDNGSDDVLLPQHDELVQFLQDSWRSIVPADTETTEAAAADASANATTNDNNSTNGEVVPVRTAAKAASTSKNRSRKQQATTTTTTAAATITKSTIPPTTRAVYYADKPSAALKDFSAFDLESWWGRRLFHSITKNA